uniref:Uncharacterized protein n=1 Tax=candidate division WOR-3 bacterium TaxID=2052148 RepID=A0A7V3NTU9_UNCW3
MLRPYYDQLGVIWQASQDRWKSLSEEWKDPVGSYFYKNFWQPWEEEMPQALKALANLVEVLEQAERTAVEE